MKAFFVIILLSKTKTSVKSLFSLPLSCSSLFLYIHWCVNYFAHVPAPAQDVRCECFQSVPRDIPGPSHHRPAQGRRASSVTTSLSGTLVKVNVSDVNRTFRRVSMRSSCARLNCGIEPISVLSCLTPTRCCVTFALVLYDFCRRTEESSGLPLNSEHRFTGFLPGRCQRAFNGVWW